jgi:hypothetical protein
MPSEDVVTRRITYAGPDAFASVLVEHLEAEGATVRWKPPTERAVPHAPPGTTVMAATGTLPAIERAVEGFLGTMERRPVDRHAEVSVTVAKP